MSKPTKEIVELSKKLHELGYKQEFNRGQYVYVKIWKDSPMILIVGTDAVMTTKTDLWLGKEYCVPIPSLSDGLDWLKENSVYCQFYFDMENKQDILEIKLGCGTILNYDEPPLHEAVLMAMVKIREAQ